jgi:hypothetical protein
MPGVAFGDAFTGRGLPSGSDFTALEVIDEDMRQMPISA